MNPFHIIIPARFNSKRLPEKILADIAGKPLIQHVYERACMCNAKSVTVATDHKTVYDVVHNFGGKALMTSTQHTNGTERLAEAAEVLRLRPSEIVVNFQGDEPFISQEAILKAVTCLENKDVMVGTLATPIKTHQEIFSPNVVKVVFDSNKQALFFSRAPVPWYRDIYDKAERDITNVNCYRHVGIYAYRVHALMQYKQWTSAPIEMAECLEQLRFIWRGSKINIELVEENLLSGIDTLEDLERAREHIIGGKCYNKS